MTAAEPTLDGQFAQIDRDAQLSVNGKYRWWLTRQWGHGMEACFIMLNPSTADALIDDPTIRRCMAFAKAWGMDALTVVNLYAYRATKPADLWLADDPVGPLNDLHLTRRALEADVVVAAWGANAKPERVAEVTALPGMNQLTALDVTKDGQPRHPLYLRGDLTPQPWRQP